LDTSASETVRSLLEQGFYQEARNVLKRWERSFPLSKLSGDYFVHEADLYMRLKNYRRARTILEAYCKHVDASSYMPSALDLLLTCMMEAKATDEQIEEFCNDVAKRFEFHPVAGRIGSLLDMLKGGTREATSDR